SQKGTVFQEAAFHKQVDDLKASLEDKDRQIEEVGAQLLKQMEESGKKLEALQAELEQWKQQAEQAPEKKKKGKAAEEGEEEDAGALQREIKRKEAQLSTLRQEFERTQVRAKRMEDILHEYYALSVNPLTIAKVSVDLIPTDKMEADDVDTVNDLRKNVEQVLEVVRGLVKKMEALEIPIERPAQAAPAPVAKPEDVPLAVPPKKPRKN
ncbi:MAG TPA: hypothetical protein VD713_07260, partial [Sphingomonadales bacterium]|nr:hypothetical protein [Sphingomonadales bacterium]